MLLAFLSLYFFPCIIFLKKIENRFCCFCFLDFCLVKEWNFLFIYYFFDGLWGRKEEKLGLERWRERLLR